MAGLIQRIIQAFYDIKDQFLVISDTRSASSSARPNTKQGGQQASNSNSPHQGSKPKSPETQSRGTQVLNPNLAPSSRIITPQKLVVTDKSIQSTVRKYDYINVPPPRTTSGGEK